ncbi:MAG: metal ABC transporter ATP-binding protein [Dehalococcoidia bacterium]|nr:metal ABC transporter ATP-binding protein [Dehalococcoidia bacterium]
MNDGMMRNGSVFDNARLADPGAEAVIYADHLDIGYNNNPVVTGIEFQLGAGQALALVGINGSGKSTLLKTLVGLIAPIQGRLTILGKRPGSLPKQIAYLSQFHASGFVLPLRAIDVVRMGRFPNRGLFGRMTRSDQEVTEAAMRMLSIEHLAELPLRSLSGGQQQRVYLAQILARQADVLILDEPTAGLDAAGREIYLRAVKAELSRGAAVITATHDIQEAAHCNQVMLLAHRVVGIGTPEEVLTPAMLLETFGIVITGDHPGVAIAEREHGHDHHHRASH